jgi:gamma-glutamyltranspeptidase/glutathione hydrolase
MRTRDRSATPLTAPARSGRRRGIAVLRGAGLTAAATFVLAAAAWRTPRLPVQSPPSAPPTLAAPRATTVRAAHGMVVSASAIASQAGSDVLRAGGNAVDAAIATGFALAVTHPTAGNIGGGGFMVIRFPDGRVTAWDFREKAPARANAKMFLDEKGNYSSTIHHNSHIAVGVPGTVAGFARAHAALGKLPWARLVEPAVGLARDGFPVSPNLARSLSGALRSMEPYPASVAAFSKSGTPYASGETLRQPDLARTLERIMQNGRDGFYKGETAKLLADEMRRGGGLITEQDLADYEAKERAPIRGTYRGYEIISMPPPSSGGIALVEMLNILEGYDLKAMGHMSAAYVHHVTEAMRRAFRDRARWLADADFAEVPVARLTSKAYATELRRGIDPRHATPSAVADVVQDDESPETTHYSVVDGSGLAVSVTYTLEAGYGSKIVVPGAGFLLNNEMGDFNAGPGLTDQRGLIGTDPNLARPGQRMLSSMTPTILAKDGKLVAVIGSPGGRTIINTVLSVVLGMVDFGMDIEAAVGSPRMHHQWLPDQLTVEESGISEETVKALEAMGHSVRVSGRQGAVHAIMIDPRTGERIGAPDPRDRDAGAVGH